MPRTADTKEQILDAAETLFSAHGIEGVSLRSLTKEANVNLASVHYHFGSKEAVVKAAFARCIRPVNRERLALLERLERGAANGRLNVEAVLFALFSPTMKLARGSSERQSFVRLCARLYSEPADYLEPFFEEEFSEVMKRFETAFAKALPGLPREELRSRMRFAIGVMAHTMLDCGRTHNWTERSGDETDPQATLASMVRFVAGGMLARPGRPSMPPTPMVTAPEETAA